MITTLPKNSEIDRLLRIRNNKSFKKQDWYESLKFNQFLVKTYTEDFEKIGASINLNDLKIVGLYIITNNSITKLNKLNKILKQKLKERTSTAQNI